MDIRKIDEALTRLRGEKNIVGMACAVTDRQGVIWEKGYGATSLEKPWDRATENTLFRIASNSKFTCGLIAMMLCEEGKMELDAPLEKYVPWFTLRDEGAAHRVTIRRLLSHTAGFPTEYTPDGPLYESELEETLKRELPALELLHDPDEGKYYYSNYGPRLVSLAIRYLTGKDFSEICQERVLDPLGMEKTTFDIRKAATYELALPHLQREDGTLYTEHLFHINATRYPTGGLFSSVHEMTSLARVKLNNGSPLISEASWREMARPHTSTGAEREGYYGLTLMMRRYGDKVLYGHTGSHPPFYSCIWVLPEAGLGICFASNTDGSQEFTNKMVPEIFVGAI